MAKRKPFCIVSAMLMLCLLLSSSAWAGEIAILDALKQKGAQVDYVNDADASLLRAKGYKYWMNISPPDTSGTNTYWWLIQDKKEQNMHYAQLTYVASGLNPVVRQESISGNVNYYYDAATGNPLMAYDTRTLDFTVTANTQKMFYWSGHEMWGQFAFFTMVEKGGRYQFLRNVPLAAMQGKAKALKIQTSL